MLFVSEVSTSGAGPMSMFLHSINSYITIYIIIYIYLYIVINYIIISYLDIRLAAALLPKLVSSP